MVQKKKSESYKTDEKKFGMWYRKEQQKGAEKKGNNSGRGTVKKNGKVQKTEKRGKNSGREGREFFRKELHSWRFMRHHVRALLGRVAH